jgi:hypothetical protein
MLGRPLAPLFDTDQPHEIRVRTFSRERADRRRYAASARAAPVAELHAGLRNSSTSRRMLAAMCSGTRHSKHGGLPRGAPP